MSNQVVTIGYLKEFLKGLINVSTDKIDTYCPTYEELTNNSIAKNFINNDIPLNVTNGIYVNKQFENGINYKPNQLVNQKDLMVKYVELISITSNADKKILNCCGDSALLTTSASFNYKTKNETGTSIDKTNVTQEIEPEYTENVSYASVIGNQIKVNKNDVAYPNNAIQRNFTLNSSYNYIFGGTKKASIDFTQEANIIGNWIDTTKETTSIQVTPSEFIFGANGGTIEYSTKRIYTQHQSKYDSCNFEVSKNSIADRQEIVTPSSYSCPNKDFVVTENSVRIDKQPESTPMKTGIVKICYDNHCVDLNASQSASCSAGYIITGEPVVNVEFTINDYTKNVSAYAPNGYILNNNGKIVENITTNYVWRDSDCSINQERTSATTETLESIISNENITWNNNGYDTTGKNRYEILNNTFKPNENKNKNNLTYTISGSTIYKGKSYTDEVILTQDKVSYEWITHTINGGTIHFNSLYETRKEKIWWTHKTNGHDDGVNDKYNGEYYPKEFHTLEPEVLEVKDISSTDGSGWYSFHFLVAKPEKSVYWTNFYRKVDSNCVPGTCYDASVDCEPFNGTCIESYDYSKASLSFTCDNSLSYNQTDAHVKDVKLSNVSYTGSNCVTSITEVMLDSSQYSVSYEPSGTNTGTTDRSVTVTVTSDSNHGSKSHSKTITQKHQTCSPSYDYSSATLSFNCDKTMSYDQTDAHVKDVKLSNVEYTDSNCVTSTTEVTLDGSQYSVSYNPSGANTGTTDRSVTVTVTSDSSHGSKSTSKTITQKHPCTESYDYTDSILNYDISKTKLTACETGNEVKISNIRMENVKHVHKDCSITYDTLAAINVTKVIPQFSTNETDKPVEYEYEISCKDGGVTKTKNTIVTQDAGPCHKPTCTEGWSYKDSDREIPIFTISDEPQILIPTDGINYNKSVKLYNGVLKQKVTKNYEWKNSDCSIDISKTSATTETVTLKEFDSSEIQWSHKYVNSLDIINGSIVHIPQNNTPNDIILTLSGSVEYNGQIYKDTCEIKEQKGVEKWECHFYKNGLGGKRVVDREIGINSGGSLTLYSDYHYFMNGKEDESKKQNAISSPESQTEPNLKVNVNNGTVSVMLEGEPSKASSTLFIDVLDKDGHEGRLEIYYIDSNVINEEPKE